jgi:hypothetical protein
MTLELAKQQDFTSIWLTQILIQVISKILASHTLQGNFATEIVTSLKIKANSMKPSAFLPQRNKCLVECELTSEVKATSENVMDLLILVRLRARLQSLALVICFPWWTSQAFASTWTQSLPQSVLMMSLSQLLARSFSTLLPLSTILIGYVGLKMLA